MMAWGWSHMYVHPSHDSCPMNFFRDSGSVVAKPGRKAAARPALAVRAKIEGEALAKPKKGKGQKAA